jgi:hypothetical protein
MGSFDFGVSLALILSFVSLVLCVGYGLYNWNKDGDTELKATKKWQQEENKINEEL